MVVLHVAAAFQVYAHPAYESMENLTRRMSPSGKLGPLKLGYDGGSWLPRLVTRSVYVVFCTAVAVLLPVSRVVETDIIISLFESFGFAIEPF